MEGAAITSPLAKARVRPLEGSSYSGIDKTGELTRYLGEAVHRKNAQQQTDSRAKKHGRKRNKHNTPASVVLQYGR